MTIPPIYENSSLDIEIPVTDEAGAAVDLTGAVVAASAYRSGTIVAATATVTDALGGVMLASFAVGDLTLGRWEFQARVTKGTKSQIVAKDSVNVEAAHV